MNKFAKWWMKLTSVGATFEGTDLSQKRRARHSVKRKKDPSPLRWWLRGLGFDV